MELRHRGLRYSELEHTSVMDATGGKMAPAGTLLSLSSDRVAGAIRSLSSTENLVIYCGAGVSIDRTGLGWIRLIQTILTEAKKRDSLGRQKEYAAADAQPGHLRWPVQPVESSIRGSVGYPLSTKLTSDCRHWTADPVCENWSTGNRCRRVPLRRPCLFPQALWLSCRRRVVASGF